MLVPLILGALAVATPPFTVRVVNGLQVVETRVAYGDLNLSSVAGRSTLDRRIRTAARQVCGPPDEIDFSERRRCIRVAYDQARQQANTLI